MHSICSACDDDVHTRVDQQLRRRSRSGRVYLAHNLDCSASQLHQLACGEILFPKLNGIDPCGRDGANLSEKERGRVLAFARQLRAISDVVEKQPSNLPRDRDATPHALPRFSLTYDGWPIERADH